MTIGLKVRTALTGGAALLALAITPAASLAADTSGTQLCNEAGMAFYLTGGTLAVDPTEDPNPPARHKSDLSALPGKGVGLVNAAQHSGALAACAATPATGSTGGDGDWSASST